MKKIVFLAVLFSFSFALASRAQISKTSLEKLSFALASDQSLVDGGLAEKYLLVDSDLTLWIFKPQAKSTSYAEEAAYLLARVIGVNTPENYCVTVKQKFKGSICRIVECKGNLKHTPPAKLSPEQVVEMQRLQVYHWLISNHDTHCKNFLLGEDGGIITIDHNMSLLDLDYLKYDIADGEATRDYSYFSAFWSAYLAGEIEVDMDKTFEIIDRIQAVDDEVFRIIYRPFTRYRKEERGYVMANEYGDPVFGGEEDFLASLLMRKSKLRSDFVAYYSRLRRRKGKGSYSPPDPVEHSPVGVSSIELDDGRFAAIEFRDEHDTFALSKRAMRYLKNTFTTATTATPEVMATAIKWRFKGGCKNLGYLLRKLGSNGFSGEEVRKLDVARLKLDNDFFLRLDRTERRNLIVLERRAKSLVLHADSEAEKRKASLVVAMLDSRLKKGVVVVNGRELFREHLRP